MRFSKPVFVLSLTVLFTICLLQTDLHAERIVDEDRDEDWLFEGWGGTLAISWYDDEGMHDKNGNWIEGKFAGASPYAFFWNISIGSIKCYYSDYAKLSNNKGTKYPIKQDASEGWVAKNDWFVDSNYYNWDVTDAPWGKYTVRNDCKLELKKHRNPDGVLISLRKFHAISELEFDIDFE